MAAAWPALLTASLLLTSCERPAIDPSQSLVGAKQLPSSKALSREIIWISRGYGDWGQAHPGRLFYELRPDGSLTVGLEARDLLTVERKESFQLSSGVAEQARRALWRVRPEPLAGVEWDIKPIGCRSGRLHDFPEIAVAFIAEGPKPGVEDDRVGVFDLPYLSSCNSKQAVEARQLVQGIIKTFPRSKVAAEFDRRWKELHAKLRS